MCHLIDGFMVGLMATSSKRTYATHQATQIYCSQSLYSCVRHCWPMPLQETLKHSKTGLAQSPVEVTAPFPGSWCAQGLFVPSECFWWVWGLILSDCASPTVLLGLLLCPWTWGISFWWDPTFFCQSLFSRKLRFWCFAGEDQRMSFYSAVMLDTSISTATSKVAPSAYPRCCQLSTCPWNLCWSFHLQVPTCSAGRSLLDRDLCGAFLGSPTMPSEWGRFVWASVSIPSSPSVSSGLWVHLSALQVCFLHHRACVLLFVVNRRWQEWTLTF